MNSYQSLVERVLIPQSVSGHDIIYPCPVCEDLSTGHHLYVNYQKGYFHCVKCNYGGRSLTKLVKRLGIDTSFDYEGLERSNIAELDKIVDIRQVKMRTVEYSKNLRMLTDYFQHHSKPLTGDARLYLRDRGLPDSLIDSLGIREGVNRYGETLTIGYTSIRGRDYSGRVIVPSIYRSGIISYFVARDYTGTKSVRYLNPPKELGYSSEDVYNLENISADYVVICEGVFSAIAVMNHLGKNVAVATYGKSIAQRSSTESSFLSVTSQGEKLLKKKFKVYYVFYDKDAEDSMMKTCKYLYDRGAKVRYVKIETEKYGKKADANDLTREEVINCIQNSREYDNLIELESLF